MVLTDRERQLLRFWAQGLNNTVIATRLGLKPQTIRNNATNLYEKIEVSDRLQALAWAAAHPEEMEPF